MHVENLVHWGPHPRGWLAVDRIYDAAVRLGAAPYAELHISRAITALACVHMLEADESSTAARLLSAAHRALDAATAIDPNVSRAHSVRGELYEAADRVEDALAAFERALELEPGRGWPALFRAGCLHALERWGEAAAAYDALDPAFFTKYRAWRYERLLEDRAWCRLQSGDIDRARDELIALVERYQRAPALAEDAYLGHLVKASRDPRLREALLERTDELMAWLGRRD